MKDNLSINNTERNIKRWKRLSKEIDIEFEEPSEIIEEISKKKSPEELMKKKPQKRDLKETLVIKPCHPDLKPALDKLLSGALSDAVIVQVSTEIDTVATLVSNRAVRGDNPDVKDSDEDMSEDEVTVFLITFF